MNMHGISVLENWCSIFCFLCLMYMITKVPEVLILEKRQWQEEDPDRNVRSDCRAIPTRAVPEVRGEFCQPAEFLSQVMVHFLMSDLFLGKFFLVVSRTVYFFQFIRSACSTYYYYNERGENARCLFFAALPSL